MSSNSNCPATPERVEQCPATPERLLNLKSSVSSDSDSDTDNERGAAGSSGSPPPNCPICLGRCRNKCFTDSCLHQFCFKCLMEWSKVKAECPLCKQAFRSIIHNVKSIDQFEEYLVQPPPVPQPMPIPAYANSRPSQNFTYRQHVAERNSMFRHLHHSPMHVPQQPVETFRGHPAQSGMSRFRLQYASDDIIPTGTIALSWRQYIYERKLYALSVTDITGAFRECTARFYRNNPAQIHRLMPWINRDLVCLLRDTDHHVTLVLHSISQLLTIYDISSGEFRKRCIPYFGGRTSHFIHELYTFARSPYDMIGYDRHARYAPSEEIIISSSSNTSSASEHEGDGGLEAVLAARTQTSRTSARRSGSYPSDRLHFGHHSHHHHHHYNRPYVGTGSSLAAGPNSFQNHHHHNLATCSSLTFSSATASTSSAASSANAAAMTSVPLSILMNMCDRPSHQQQQQNEQQQQQQQLQHQIPSTSVAYAPTEITSLSAFIGPQCAETAETSGEGTTANTNNGPVADGSTSDECEFIMEQKPPHLRTPELVELNSDSDSDVVFVSESKTSKPGPLQLKAIARSKIQNRRGTPRPCCAYPTSSEDDEEDNRTLSSFLNRRKKTGESNALEESTAAPAASNTGVDATDENNENRDENESNYNNADNNDENQNDNERPSTSTERHSDNNDNAYNSVLRYRKRTNNERPKRAEAQKYKKDLFRSSSNDETDDEDADVDIEKRRKYEYNTSEETTEPFLPYTDDSDETDSSWSKGKKRRLKKRRLSRTQRSEMMNRRFKNIENNN